MSPEAEAANDANRAVSRTIRIAQTLSLLTLVIGLCVLAGWALGIPSLTTVLPGLVTMKPYTAISVLLGGGSLFLLTLPSDYSRKRHISGALAFAMAVLGLATLLEYTLGLGSRLDELLFKDPTVSGAPGRMAPITALNSVCIGIALIFLQLPRRRVAAHALAAVAAFTSALAIVGFIYGVTPLYASGRFTAVALHTSVAFMFLAIGVWCAGSQSGFMRVVTNTELSGKLVRRYVPAALIMPFVVGWLRVQGVRHGLFGPEIGVVIVAMSNAMAFIALVWVGSRSLRTSEREQTRIQAELRESEARLNLVVEHLTEGLVIWNLEGTLLHWNQAALTMHGFASQEEGLRLIPDFEKIFEMSSLEGTALPANEWPLARLLAGQPLDHVEVCVRRRDQAWDRIFSYGGSIVHGRDGRQLAFLTISDVTAQKQAQERFREVANAMPQMVWTARADGFIDYYNRRWYEYTGARRDLFGDASWENFPHPDDLPAVARQWSASIADSVPFEMEFRLLGVADGAHRWFLTRGVPIKDSDGRVLRWIGTNTDIHESKMLREQNERLLTSERAARTEAERSSQMKDEFLSTLSHELRTPLNAILGWAQLLQDVQTGVDDVTQGIATIERNARAQKQIIDDLLDMSSIISGKLRLDVQRIELVPVLEAALETMRPAAEAKGIGLQVTLDPKAHAISGDPNRLQQVFWNLISNAIKFTARGGRVQVILERIESHLEVIVTDSGEGISADFLPFVFDRFRQADASASRRHGGLGLGLAIVKQLVELHGGSVRVTSAGLNAGTTFAVVLPIIAVHLESVSPEATRNHPPDVATVAQTLDLGGVKVLVVDDEADARDLLQRALEDRGATVRTAGSAAEALELLQVEKPDVLVSDIGMPGQDGYSLMLRVRTLGVGEGGSVPAVALTAYAREDDRVKAIKAGFQLHLAKPVEAAELVAMVASLSGRTGHVEAKRA